MLQRIRISTLLSLGFGLVIALILAMSLVVYVESDGVKKEAFYLIDDVNPKASAAATIRLNIVRNWANTLLLMQTRDKDRAGAITAEMSANSKVISEQLEFLEKNAKQAKGKELVGDIQKARQNYTENRKKYLDMIKAGDTLGAADYLTTTLNQNIGDYTAVVGKFFQYQSEKMEGTSRKIHSQSTFMAASTVGVALIAMLVALVAAFVVIKAIHRILGGDAHYANAVVNEIAGGNLAVQITVDPRDTGSLLSSMRTMRDHLRDTVASIQRGAEQVGSAAVQLVRNADSVATASVRQSEATTTTAAAIEEMTVGIDSISSNAQHARQFSHEAASLSKRGGEVIHGASAEMERIATSVEVSSDIIGRLENQSREISKVVEVIKEIAEQTNLLALNAAIEAARAGEAGRGFAVVADEVRKLAERTTQSTFQVTKTIDDIQHGTQEAVQSMMAGVGQVRTGTDLARSAGESIQKIQADAAGVATVIDDISSSLSEQSKACAEVARNVEGIARTVEENNASAQEAATAAHQLQRLAEELTSSIKVFRI